MLIDAEIQRKDGSRRSIRLWVDSGSPNFFMSESLALDLGIDLSAAKNSGKKISNLEIPPSSTMSIGGMKLNFDGIQSAVMFQPFWLFTTMHIDANLPSTLLKKYHVIFDYPNRQFTIAEPGTLKPSGTPYQAGVNAKTGIVQLDAVIDGASYSFALDNGASYSFVSEEIVQKLLTSHPESPRMVGTLGYANMWGWWPPNEQTFSMIRLPKITWGSAELDNIGIVGVPKFSPNGLTLGDWYSQKTERPVDGFLGANALKSFRVEIDYANKLVYFEKRGDIDAHEMDMVGLSVRQLADGRYQIVGIAKNGEKLSIEGVESGDILIAVGDLNVQGITMGKVVDALRGKPSDRRLLVLERDGKLFKIEAEVKHFL
jgi:hypothetical protein